MIKKYLFLCLIALLIISGCLYKSQTQIEEENLLKEVGWNQSNYEKYSKFYVYLVNNGCLNKVCIKSYNTNFELDEILDEIPQWKNEFEKTWYLVFSNYQKAIKENSATTRDMYYEKSYENCIKIVGWNPSAAKAESIKYKRNKSILNVGQEQTYKTIQSAIDAANELDIISVDEGTYFENIVLKKPVLLVGKNKNNTIIDGKGRGSVININNVNSVIISGFTIQNSGGNETEDVGIKIYSANGIKIINNIIINNWIGISIIPKDNTIYQAGEVNNMVRYNDINFNHKYGIFIKWSANNEIYNNSIKNNEFGIFLKNAGHNNEILWNSLINNNEQAYDDGYRNIWRYNYWSDLNNSDNVYIIPGGHDKYNYPVDNFPLSNPIIIRYESIQFSEPIRDNICVLNKEIREAEKKDVLGIGRYG